MISHALNPVLALLESQGHVVQGPALCDESVHRMVQLLTAAIAPSLKESQKNLIKNDEKCIETHLMRQCGGSPSVVLRIHGSAPNELLQCLLLYLDPNCSLNLLTLKRCLSELQSTEKSIKAHFSQVASAQSL